MVSSENHYNEINTFLFQKSLCFICFIFTKISSDSASLFLIGISFSSALPHYLLWRDRGLLFSLYQSDKCRLKENPVHTGAALLPVVWIDASRVMFIMYTQTNTNSVPDTPAHTFRGWILYFQLVLCLYGTLKYNRVQCECSLTPNPVCNSLKNPTDTETECRESLRMAGLPTLMHWPWDSRIWFTSHATPLFLTL